MYCLFYIPVIELIKSRYPLLTRVLICFKKGISMYDVFVTLKKGEGRTLKNGGAWVYDNEIDSVAGSFENGDIVTVRDFDVLL